MHTREQSGGYPFRWELMPIWSVVPTPARAPWRLPSVASAFRWRSAPRAGACGRPPLCSPPTPGDTRTPLRLWRGWRRRRRATAASRWRADLGRSRPHLPDRQSACLPEISALSRAMSYWILAGASAKSQSVGSARAAGRAAGRVSGARAGRVPGGARRQCRAWVGCGSAARGVVTVMTGSGRRGERAAGKVAGNAVAGGAGRGGAAHMCHRLVRVVSVQCSSC